MDQWSVENISREIESRQRILKKRPLASRFREATRYFEDHIIEAKFEMASHRSRSSDLQVMVPIPGSGKDVEFHAQSLTTELEQISSALRSETGKVDIAGKREMASECYRLLSICKWNDYLYSGVNFISSRKKGKEELSRTADRIRHLTGIVTEVVEILTYDTYDDARHAGDSAEGHSYRRLMGMYSPYDFVPQMGETEELQPEKYKFYLGNLRFVILQDREVRRRMYQIPIKGRSVRITEPDHDSASEYETDTASEKSSDKEAGMLDNALEKMKDMSISKMFSF